MKKLAALLILAMVFLALASDFVSAQEAGGNVCIVIYRFEKVFYTNQSGKAFIDKGDAKKIEEKDYNSPVELINEMHSGGWVLKHSNCYSEGSSALRVIYFYFEKKQ